MSGAARGPAASAAPLEQVPAAATTPRVEVFHLPRRPQDPAPVSRPEVTILVVDGDGVSRRFVELSLERETGWHVESAKDGAAALEILRTSQIDAIIAEKDLPDMQGLALYEKLRQQSRLENLPFLFFTSDTKVASRVLAFRSGVDDYLPKPCDAMELVARISAQVRRARKARRDVRRRSYTLAGDLAVMELPDLVTTLYMQRRSGVLSVTTGRAAGEVFLELGEVVHARYGNVSGPRAFHLLMGEAKGQFEFTLGACELEPADRTIHESVTALVLEGARVLDTERMEKGEARSEEDLVSAVEQRTDGESRRALEDHPPTASAAQFEHGLRDPFKLGELKLLSPEELFFWTRDMGGRERMHVHLIADLQLGISALLPLASAQTERDLLIALRPERKALVLSFYLRGDRLVDAVLIDIQAAQALQKSLGRIPTLTVLAPPDGDFLAVGTKARVELEELLRELPPATLLGIGNAALGTHLNALNILRHSPIPRACVEGGLGQERADLRELLAQGIKLWGSA